LFIAQLHSALLGPMPQVLLILGGVQDTKQGEVRVGDSGIPPVTNRDLHLRLIGFT